MPNEPTRTEFSESVAIQRKTKIALNMINKISRKIVAPFDFNKVAIVAKKRFKEFKIQLNCVEKIDQIQQKFVKSHGDF